METLVFQISAWDSKNIYTKQTFQRYQLHISIYILVTHCMPLWFGYIIQEQYLRHGYAKFRWNLIISSWNIDICPDLPLKYKFTPADSSAYLMYGMNTVRLLGYSEKWYFCTFDTDIFAFVNRACFKLLFKSIFYIFRTHLLNDMLVFVF